MPRLRDLALQHRAPDPDHLITSRALGWRVVLAALLLAAVGGPGAVLAADPTSNPAGQTPSPPSCADRFPAAGPAGVDLRLGCLVSEVHPEISQYFGSRRKRG